MKPKPARVPVHHRFPTPGTPSRRTAKCRLALFGLAFVLWPLGLVGQTVATNRGQVCFRTNLVPPPQWAQEAFISASGDQLQVVDLGRNQLMAYTLDGRPTSSRLELVQRTTPDFELGDVRPVGRAVEDAARPETRVLRLRGGRFMKIVDGLPMTLGKTPTGQRVDVLELREWQVAQPAGYENSFNPGRPDSPYTWTVAGDDLVVFTDVGFEPRNSGEVLWLSGYLRVPLRLPGDEERLHFLQIEGAEHEDADKSVWEDIRASNPLLNRLGLHLLTSDDSSAYVLVFGEKPSIYVNTKDSGKLKRLGLPEAGLGQTPAVQYGYTFQDELPAMMETIEETAFTTGIYAWRGSLLLLHRKPAVSGTEWTLIRVDPGTGRQKGLYKLPTTTNHAVLALGDPFVAIVEKGPYLSWAEQSIPSVVYFPSRALETLGTGDAREPRDLCSQVPSVQSLTDVRRIMKVGH